MSSDPKDGSTTESWETRRWDSKPSPEVMRKLREEDAAKAAATLAPKEGAAVVDAAKTIKLGDFMKVHQYPCHRQGYLAGIGGGAAVGALRYILGGKQRCPSAPSRSRSETDGGCQHRYPRRPTGRSAPACSRPSPRFRSASRSGGRRKSR